MVVGKGCHLISQGHTHNICIFIKYLIISLYTKRQTVYLNLHYVPKMCLKVPVHPYLQVYVCLLCNLTRPMTKSNIIWLACSQTCSKCRELQVGKSRVCPELCVCKIGVWPQICWHGRKIRASAEQHT